jgi:nucleoside-diphosphate-sugar epimerase
MARGTFPESARETFGVSVACTQQLLDYCIRSGAKQFILASTGDVYGRRLDPCKETDPPRPESFYGATKYSAELLVQAYSEYLVPTVLRIFHAYGPGQSQKLVAYLAKQIRSHATVQIHQGHRPYLTPTYIDDVCLAFEKALETSYSGVLNVAGDTVISVKGIAELIAEALGREALFEDTGKDVGNMIGVNELLKKELKMDSLVGLNEGLSRTFKNRKEP